MGSRKKALRKQKAQNNPKHRAKMAKKAHYSTQAAKDKWEAKKAARKANRPYDPSTEEP